MNNVQKLEDRTWISVDRSGRQLRLWKRHATIEISGDGAAVQATFNDGGWATAFGYQAKDGTPLTGESAYEEDIYQVNAFCKPCDEAATIVAVLARVEQDLNQDARLIEAQRQSLADIRARQLVSR